MLIYAISGAPRSGKTTLAYRLVGRVHGSVWDLAKARLAYLDYYANLEMRLRQARATGLLSRIALDGIDTLDEIRFLREKFPMDTIVHWHVVDGAIDDIPSEEGLRLALQADYGLTWRRLHG